MKKQSGNALWFILLAIFLLGGLTVLLSRTGSNTEETGSAEQTSIKASALLRYAAGLENGVTRLLNLGCSESQISIDPDVTTVGYENPKSPVDRSCHLFYPEGAGLSFTGFKADGTPMPLFISGNIVIDNVGTTKPELAAGIGILTQETCKQINKSVGLGAVAPYDNANGAAGLFDGSYTAIARLGNDYTALAGQKYFCAASVGPTDYQLFYVLIAR